MRVYDLPNREINCTPLEGFFRHFLACEARVSHAFRPSRVPESLSSPELDPDLTQLAVFRCEIFRPDLNGVFVYSNSIFV
jgi:hypothetical protein